MQFYVYSANEPIIIEIKLFYLRIFVYSKKKMVKQWRISWFEGKKDIEKKKNSRKQNY